MFACVMRRLTCSRRQQQQRDGTALDRASAPVRTQSAPDGYGIVPMTAMAPATLGVYGHSRQSLCAWLASLPGDVATPVTGSSSRPPVTMNHCSPSRCVQGACRSSVPAISSSTRVPRCCGRPSDRTAAAEIVLGLVPSYVCGRHPARYARAPNRPILLAFLATAWIAAHRCRAPPRRPPGALGGHGRRGSRS